MLRIMVRRSSQICGLQSGSANKNIAFDHRLCKTANNCFRSVRSSNLYIILFFNYRLRRCRT